MVGEVSLQTRSRRKDARSLELLDAASVIFGEKGYQHTKLEDIAAHAGVTRATLYLYYKNKEDIFRATVTSAVESRRVLIDELEAIRGRDAASDVKEALRLIHLALQVPRLARVHRLMILEPDTFSDLARVYKAQNTRMIEVLAAHISRGIDEGSFRRIDPARAARVAILPASASLFWIALQSTGRPDHLDPPFVPAEFLAYHRDLFVRGLTVDAG